MVIRPTRREPVLEETLPDAPGGIVVCVESLKSIDVTGENQPCRRSVVCVINCGIRFQSEGSDSGYPPRNLYEQYLSSLQRECFSLSFVRYGTRVYPFASDSLISLVSTEASRTYRKPRYTYRFINVPYKSGRICAQSSSSANRAAPCEPVPDC